MRTGKCHVIIATAYGKSPRNTGHTNSNLILDHTRGVIGKQTTNSRSYSQATITESNCLALDGMNSLNVLDITAIQGTLNKCNSRLREPCQDRTKL